MPSCIEIIERRLGREVPDDFVDTYNARSFEAFRRDLQPVPGIEEAIGRIRVPLCVASSASHEKMRTTLGVTRLLRHFEGRMFSATEVGRGKPDPALFLHAAQSMGVAPEASAVVEDTVVGVQAARAAGMSAYAYAAAADDATRRAFVDEGARLFEAMVELPELLEER
jgi:HAD superfamily hydrolase (TIGR01509 family)